MSNQFQATHSLLTASFPCRVNCMLLEVNTLITSCPSIQAHKHTYTLLSVLIRILVTPLADSNKKRDRRIKSFSLFSKDGMASLPRYVQTCITYSICVTHAAHVVSPYVVCAVMAHSHVECIHRKKRATSNDKHLECALFRVPHTHTHTHQRL